MGKLYRLYLYRPLMRFAHRFNWHHMKVCYIEGDVMDWCEWCGIRKVRPKMETPTAYRTVSEDELLAALQREYPPPLRSD